MSFSKTQKVKNGSFSAAKPNQKVVGPLIKTGSVVKFFIIAICGNDDAAKFFLEGE